MSFEVQPLAKNNNPLLWWKANAPNAIQHWRSWQSRCYVFLPPEYIAIWWVYLNITYLEEEEEDQSGGADHMIGHYKMALPVVAYIFSWHVILKNQN